MHMNVILTEKYICRKLRMTDDLYGIMAERVGKQAFFSAVLDSKIAKLDPEFIKWHQHVIERRYKLNPKRKLLFPKPTVRQWIMDLAGDYQPDDMLEFFAQSSGISVAVLQKANIESTVLDRPFLIDLVDKLEAATGKSLNNMKENDFPLRYLGDVKYTDLADYFSAKGSEKIDIIRRKAGLL